MRLLSASLLSVVLLLGACGGDGTETDVDDPAGSPATSPVAASPDASPSPNFVSSTRCESPEGFSVEYPADWHTNSGEVVPECSQFSPEEFEVPEGTDERVAPITIFIDPVEFFRAASPDQQTSNELNRAATVIDGRQAVRVQQEATGDGLYPPGTEQTLYIVDLNLGPDDTEPGTLFLTTVDVGDFDYRANTGVLDRMARSMTITAGDLPEEEFSVIARYEGGGGGFTMVAEPSNDQVCLRIPPEGEPACLDEPGTQEIATDLFPVVGPERALAGLAGNEVFRIEARQSDGLVQLVLPAGIDGTTVRGWALAGDSRDVEELVWYGIGGDELGSRSLH